MAKAEWGLKRVCPHCGAHFYDMRRDPITCPKCAAVFDPAAQVRARRAAAKEEPKPVPKAAKPVPVPDEEVPIGDTDEDAEVADEEEDDEALEDASELGEDEDDVAEVIEKVDENEER